MFVVFKLRDAFAEAARRKDFSSPELTQLRDVLKKNGLNADMPAFFVEEKPTEFSASGKAYKTHIALRKDQDFQEKVKKEIEACAAVEKKVFFVPMFN